MPDIPSPLLPWDENENVQTLRQGLLFYQDVGMVLKGLSKRTQVEYSRDVTEMIVFLEERGVVELASVRLRALQAYSHHLAKSTLRRSSHNRKIDAVKSFFRCLHEQGIIRLDPAEQLVSPSPIEREPRILTQEEYQRLLEVCAHNVRDQAIIVLYLQTGMRLSELVSLQLGDIELPQEIGQDEAQAGFVRLTRSKGKVERVPLNYKASEALVAYLARRPASESSCLFLNRFEEPLSKRRIQYMVKGYLEQIGVGDASVKTLRHSMAAHHVAQGTDLQVIQETLGISLQATERYVSLAKRTARKALQEHAL